MVLGNPVSAELKERKVDHGLAIDKIEAQLAERFGSHPMESAMQAWVWQAQKE